MTAKSVSAPQKSDVVATQTSRCTHQAIIPGLDHVQCKNCRRCWPHWHPDYERLLIQPVVNKEITPEPTHEQKAWVQTYWVKRNGNKHEYYRFCYLTNPSDIGSCVRRHIPGGNTKSEKAIAHKQEVERAIADGWWPSEIEELIKSLKK